jgi:hypothetical protein
MGLAFSPDGSAISRWARASAHREAANWGRRHGATTRPRRLTDRARQVLRVVATRSSFGLKTRCGDPDLGGKHPY